MKIANLIVSAMALTTAIDIKQVSAARIEHQELVEYHDRQECMNILQAALSSCGYLGPFAPACVAAAWLAYAGCMACDC